MAEDKHPRMDKASVLKLALERMDEAYEADIENRDRALDDLRFVIGEQWPEDVKREREADGKPCLTINGLPQYVRQTTAQIRNLNPAIRVTPSDNEAEEEIADLLAGIVRHIENKCDASSIYEQAAESAAQCGIGHWRVRTEYCDEASFDQEILIERIPNPFAVFWDPLAKEPSRSDARYCLIAEDVDKDDFAAQYKEASLTDATSEHREGRFQWGKADSVTVAEYFWVMYDEYELIDGPQGPMRKDKWPEGLPDTDFRTGKPWRTRKVKDPHVMWAKISGSDVLEGPQRMPCKQIPVFSVTGEEIHVGDEMYRSSVVRYAKDPQQLYNYARSTQAEIASIQPRAPYLVTPKQIAGLESFWAAANNANRPYLPYNPDEKASGAPQRVPPPVSSQASMTEIQLAAEDMKRTTGIYDAALGARSNETSGVAINARKLEAQNATSVYADNMVKAITQCGKVIVDMITKVYDTQRVVKILGEDDQEKMVVINQMFQTLDGPVYANDVTKGRYDVRVSVGPSYQTLRQEAAEGQMQFLQVVPEARQIIADLIAGNQEWPEADRIAERLRKMLPPGMEEEEEEPSPEKMQAQQAQMQQQQAMQQMEMRLKQAELQKAEAEAREAVADAAKAEAEAATKALELRAMTAPPVQPPLVRPIA